MTLETDDSSVQEMPTITSLLRRKKAANSNTKKPEADPEFVLETNQLRTNVTRSAPGEPGQYSKILAGNRRPKGSPKHRIPSWKLEEIQSGSQSKDPQSQAAWTIIESGALAILRLKCVQDASGASFWQATRAWGPRELRSLWSGFKWDPALHPGLWATLSNTGFYEISPNLVKSGGDWSSVRRTFGAQPTDFLSFFRTGSDECLAVIGPKSLNSIAKSIAALFAQPDSKSSAA